MTVIIRTYLISAVNLLFLVPLHGQGGEDVNQRLIFPTVVSTDQRKPVFLDTTLLFMNLSNTTAQLELTAFAVGEPVPVFGPPSSSTSQKSTMTLEMAPNSAEQITLRQEEDLEGESAFVDGWVLVEAAQNIKLQGSAEVRRFHNHTVMSDTQLQALEPAYQFYVFTTFDWWCQGGVSSMSAFSFVNPSEEEIAQVHVTVAPDFERTSELAPLGRLSIFLSELFPGLVPDPGEVCPPVPTGIQANLVVKISSDLPVAVSTLDFELGTGQFVALPVSIEID